MTLELLMQGAIIVMALSAVGRAWEQRRTRRTTERILRLVEQGVIVARPKAEPTPLRPALGSWEAAADELKQRTLAEFPRSA